MYKEQKSALRHFFKVESGYKAHQHYKSKSPSSGDLYIKGTKEKIPLTSIEFAIEIIDSLAFICLTQNYINTTSKPIETEYFFSIASNACFYKFEAQIDGQILLGQIKEKNEAKAEYIENKAKGNTVAYAESNEKVQDVMKFNIGNIPPNKPIQITFGYLHELDVCLNKFWKLVIPSTLTPRYQSKQGPNTKKQLARNSSKNEEKIEENLNFPQVEKGYNWKVMVILNSSSETNFIRSTSHEITVEKLDPAGTQFLINLKNENELPNKDFTLIFRYASINETNCLLSQIDDIQYPYCSMVSFFPNFNDSNDEDTFQAIMKDSVKDNYEVNLLKAKGEFIFILDRSGSMSGHRIDMAKKALKLFVKSLPPDSYLNIIGFGNDYQCLFDKSQKIDEDLLDHVLNHDIPKIKADLGGTELYKPLLFALESKKINKHPKNIFMLTDGEVGNVDTLLSLILRNNEESRIYTIGIGNGCSREIIMEGARLGKGKYEFIADNEDMNQKIITLLEDSITPFLSEFSVSYDKELIEMISPAPESISFIRKNEEMRMFLFLNEKLHEQKNTMLKLNYYDNHLQKTISKEIAISVDGFILKNDYLHRYGAFQLIKRIQRNLICDKEIDSDLYLAKKQDLEPFCLNLALKYQILTPFTAFICVIKENKNQIQEKSEKITVPSLVSEDYNPHKLRDSSSDSSDLLSDRKNSIKCMKKKKRSSSKSSSRSNKQKKCEKKIKEVSNKQKKCCVMSDSDSDSKMKKKKEASNKKKKLCLSDSDSDSNMKKKKEAMPNMKMKKKQSSSDDETKKKAKKIAIDESDSDSDTMLKMKMKKKQSSSDEATPKKAMKKAIQSDYEEECEDGKILYSDEDEKTLKKNLKKEEKKEFSEKKQNLLESLIENQKMQGFWEMKANLNLISSKDLSYFQGSIPGSFKDQPEVLWITCLILFHLDFFQSDKIGSWKLIFKKGTQFLESKGVNYEQFKEEAKKFFYGGSIKPKNQEKMLKKCDKCKEELKYLNNLESYKTGHFECDRCGAINLIKGGINHCEDCGFDLCEECNDSTQIKCGFCVDVLKWGGKENGTCNVCSQMMNKEIYLCNEKSCGFKMCLNCKAQR